jgi:hypothetical protein
MTGASAELAGPRDVRLPTELSSRIIDDALAAVPDVHARQAVRRLKYGLVCKAWRRGAACLPLTELAFAGLDGARKFVRAPPADIDEAALVQVEALSVRSFVAVHPSGIARAEQS